MLIDKLPRPWMHEHATGPVEETQVVLDADQKAALQELRHAVSFEWWPKQLVLGVTM